MTRKQALITGVTGQDGYYLSKLLLEEDYRVIGLVPLFEKDRPQILEAIDKHIDVVFGDLSETEALTKLIGLTRPDEIYNLGAQSNVAISAAHPYTTTEINAMGPARLLEAARLMSPKTKFFQASSSEIFGWPEKSPQTEETPLSPRNPYGWSKAMAHHLVTVYREHHGLFACSGICYNHESERRPADFVTRKITRTAAKIKLGQAQDLVLGNISAVRDWGYAPDFVKAFKMMLSAAEPEDFVISTGLGHTVEDFCQAAFDAVDLDYKNYIKTEPNLYRENEPVALIGNPEKVKNVLGWKAETGFDDLIRIMVEADLELISNTD